MSYRSFEQEYLKGLNLFRRICKRRGTTPEFVRENKGDRISVVVVMELAQKGLGYRYKLSSKTLAKIAHRHHTTILAAAGRTKTDAKVYQHDLRQEIVPEAPPAPLDEQKARTLLRRGMGVRAARKVLQCTHAEINAVSAGMKRRRDQIALAIDSMQQAREEIETATKLLPIGISVRYQQRLTRAVALIDRALTWAETAKRASTESEP